MTEAELTNLAANVRGWVKTQIKIEVEAEREACAKHLEQIAEECSKEGSARDADFVRSLAEGIRDRGGKA